MVNTKALKYARTEAGYTQKELAEVMGIQQNCYHRKESGEIGFTDKDKLLLTKLLHLDLDAFYCIFFNNEFQLANKTFYEGYISDDFR